MKIMFIYGCVLESNIPSQKVLEKNGFRKIGKNMISMFKKDGLFYKYDLTERATLNKEK